MRRQIFNPDTNRLVYGIREMVELSQRIAQLNPDFRFIGENIGDPVAKGWRVPEFVKEIMRRLIRAPGDRSFGYTHSRGCIETRQWVAELSRRLAPASRLDAEHVLFTNGLGGAISVFYRMLKQGARILQPLPGRPAERCWAIAPIRNVNGRLILSILKIRCAAIRKWPESF